MGIAMGNSCCNRKKAKKKIVLLLVGLDNAGKSVTAKGLAGESLDTVVPTNGLSVVYLKYNEYIVKVFDLGGGCNIRAIWQRYFVDAHGVIFVVDSSDYPRLDEARDVLQDLLSHEKIARKPVLLLANKQDQQDALDEIDLVEKLQLESLVNRQQCPTLVESCSATDIQSRVKKKNQVDPGIQKGYRWLMNYIIRDYQKLNARVIEDVKQQEIEEQKARMEKIERLRKLNEAAKVDDDIIESFSDYDRKLNGEIGSTKQTSFDEYVISGPCNVGDSISFSSSKSIDSFPHTYFGGIFEQQESLEERPKSARQLVKEQLKLESRKPRSPFMSFFANKTAPAHLYGMKHPQSASERREHFANDRRVLKSAGDSSLFLTTLPNSVFPETDELHRELFHLNNFQKQKLPPLKVKPVNGNREWAQKPYKSGLSIVEID